MRKLSVITVFIFLTGCVSYSDRLVNADGQVAYCEQSGWGFVGAPLAAHASNTCIDGWKAAGYVEFDKAGGIGLNLSSDVGAPRILLVVDQSPAALAGIVAGDYLIAVEHQPVSNPVDARRLLFGKPGALVSVTIRHNNETKELSIVRVSYTTFRAKK